MLHISRRLVACDKVVSFKSILRKFKKNVNSLRNSIAHEKGARSSPVSVTLTARSITFHPPHPPRMRCLSIASVIHHHSVVLPQQFAATLSCILLGEKPKLIIGYVAKGSDYRNKAHFCHNVVLVSVTYFNFLIGWIKSWCMPLQPIAAEIPSKTASRHHMVYTTCSLLGSHQLLPMMLNHVKMVEF